METTNQQPFVFKPSAPGTLGAAPGRATGKPPESLVQATSREITAIVREVAQAAKTEQPIDQFLNLFADRVLRAMAAAGVTVWRGSENDSTFHAAASVGRQAEKSIPSASIPVMQRLLQVVSADGKPVVVPPTPGAVDPSSLSNPADVPVAIVPIESNASLESSKYLLQIFLDGESGIATQRGYLRFAAQMADLAGEFIRAHEQKRLFDSHQFVRRVDDAILRLHQPVKSARIEAIVADLAAEVFAFEQVGLCYFDGRDARLAAANHVNEIDFRSPAAKRLQSTATFDLKKTNFVELRVDVEDSRLGRAIVAAPEGDGSIRLVALRDSESEPTSETVALELQRFVTHADMALRNANRLESIPGARLLSSISAKNKTLSVKRWTRPLMVVAVLTALLLVALFPLPVLVTAPGTVRPAQRQTLTAPRDAVVQTVHVDHGQRVKVDDPLVTLDDPKLGQQLTSLVGRQAVLLQQKNRLTSAMVESNNGRREQASELQMQQSLVQEEIIAIDQQLTLLRQIQSALVIRADREGIVDGWRLHERLAGRPLSRGDHLLHVVQTDSDWIVEAKIPQNRLVQVGNARDEEDLIAEVSLDANPNQSWQASLLQLGPSFAGNEEQVSSTAALLRLQREAWSAASRDGTFDAQTGAPAQVVFRCGRAPAGYLLFQDLIRSVRGTISMYLGTNKTALEDQS